MNHKQVTFTLVCTLPKIERVVEPMKELLGERNLYYVEEDGEHLFTLPDYTRVRIAYAPATESKEKLDSEFINMFRYYSGIKTEHTSVQLGLLQHIKLANNIITIKFDFTEDENRNNFLYTGMLQIAKRISAFIASGNLDVYSSEGKLILAGDGRSELTHYTPLVNIDNMYYRETVETDKDREIYKESNKILAEKNIKIQDNPKLALRHDDLSFRSKEEVCKRMLSLFLVSVYAEALLRGDKQEALNIIKGLNVKFGVKDFLSNQESIFVNFNDVSETAKIFFIWRFEACNALLWALGLSNNINDIKTPVNVHELILSVLKFKNFDDLLANTTLRSNEELFKQQDLNYRYRWASLQSKLNKEENNELNDNLISQRQHAFNWVITKLFGDNWDEVTAPA